MIEREILIANTKTQKRSKITTAATTLGELKVALAAAGVDYGGMTFTEGISKTQLLEDGTQLPQNVMYKGQPTNNLVILLTNTKKNIASGSDRQAAYEAIKSNCLQDAVKEHFGRNFTQVSTDDLWNFMGSAINKPTMPEVNKDAFEGINGGSGYDEDAETEEVEEDTTDGQKIVEAIKTFIDNLCYWNILSAEDLDTLASDISSLSSYHQSTTPQVVVDAEPVSTSDGSITDDDIDDIINGLNM